MITAKQFEALCNSSESLYDIKTISKAKRYVIVGSLVDAIASLENSQFSPKKSYNKYPKAIRWLLEIGYKIYSVLWQFVNLENHLKTTSIIEYLELARDRINNVPIGTFLSNENKDFYFGETKDAIDDALDILVEEEMVEE